jgi:hypothetical protein
MEKNRGERERRAVWISVMEKKRGAGKRRVG